MKGIKEVIELLNEVLAGELVAINQYFSAQQNVLQLGVLQARRARSSRVDRRMKHADKLTDRILFLDGLPNYQRLDKLHIGQTVPEQMAADLALEMNAIKLLNDGIALCRSRGDNGTEDLLKEILVSEEEHVDWIETQLRLIRAPRRGALPRRADVKARALERAMPKILVVDDQRNMRTTLAMMLRGAGYEVDEASDGSQGADMGGRGAYDVVLTDLRMGASTGSGSCAP